ncbi:MAG: hypothetical protein M1812_005035 [Candelaria pacifica]|nr:MAG: hypothetical protein M1812_005035 [Candelaria pacifica]
MLCGVLQKLLLLVNLLNLVTAIPSKVNNRAAADCHDYSITVTVTSENLQWAYPPFKTNYDVAQLIANTTDAATFSPFTTGKKNETASYRIAATFCAPDHAEGGTVLLASHGLGFDRSYWNSPYKPEQYNFKDYAIAHGYSVFTYDRLGVGTSDIVSGYTNQASVQAAVLRELTKLVRKGQYTGNTGTPKAIVLVGHSYGSYLSNSLIASDPTIADAAVLTGIKYGSSIAFNVLVAWGARIASTQAPPKFADRDTGYLSWTDVYTNAETFFHQPNYETDALQFTEDTKMPFGILEMVSLGTMELKAPQFNGPVLVLNGEHDLLQPGGGGSGFQASAESTFTGSKKVVAAIHPGAGHGFNFHTNATGAYGVMLDFVKSSGF